MMCDRCIVQEMHCVRDKRRYIALVLYCESYIALALYRVRDGKEALTVLNE